MYREQPRGRACRVKLDDNRKAVLGRLKGGSSHGKERGARVDHSAPPSSGLVVGFQKPKVSKMAAYESSVSSSTTSEHDRSYHRVSRTPEGIRFPTYEPARPQYLSVPPMPRSDDRALSSPRRVSNVSTTSPLASENRRLGNSPVRNGQPAIKESYDSLVKRLREVEEKQRAAEERARAAELKQSEAERLRLEQELAEEQRKTREREETCHRLQEEIQAKKKADELEHARTQLKLEKKWMQQQSTLDTLSHTNIVTSSSNAINANTTHASVKDPGVINSSTHSIRTVRQSSQLAPSVRFVSSDNDHVHFPSFERRTDTFQERPKPLNELLKMRDTSELKESIQLRNSTTFQYEGSAAPLSPGRHLYSIAENEVSKYHSISHPPVPEPKLSQTITKVTERQPSTLILSSTAPLVQPTTVPPSVRTIYVSAAPTSIPNVEVSYAPITYHQEPSPTTPPSVTPPLRVVTATQTYAQLQAQQAQMQVQGQTQMESLQHHFPRVSQMPLEHHMQTESQLPTQTSMEPQPQMNYPVIPPLNLETHSASVAAPSMTSPRRLVLNSHGVAAQSGGASFSITETAPSYLEMGGDVRKPSVTRSFILAGGEGLRQSKAQPLRTSPLIARAMSPELAPISTTISPGGVSTTMSPRQRKTNPLAQSMDSALAEQKQKPHHHSLHRSALEGPRYGSRVSTTGNLDPATRELVDAAYERLNSISPTYPDDQSRIYPVPWGGDLESTAQSTHKVLESSYFEEQSFHALATDREVSTANACCIPTRKQKTKPSPS